MTQIRQADRGLPTSAIYLLVALVAAITITTLLVLGNVDLRIGGPTMPLRHLDPDVIRSGQQWEAERRAQMGVVDPVQQSGDDWEEQRREQSGDSD